jgi:ATP adenylyltransferase
MDYIQNSKQVEGCVFCNALADPENINNLILHSGQRAFVILNRYPYTSGHLMVVPRMHASSLQELAPEIRAEIMELATRAILALSMAYQPQGFNLGMNLGEVAGAGITDHIHLHVVPRWSGDTNFMSATAGTRVLPESLEDTRERLKKAWEIVNTV